MKFDTENSESAETFVCFAGTKRLAEGTIADVAMAAWAIAQSNPTQTTLTFSRKTGRVVDLDLRGSAAEVSARYTAEPEPSPKRGRPRLGVTAREITLLPRHWDWLAGQPGGASVTLRRLVETARKNADGHASTREKIEPAYKFMSAMAGDLPSFEEASRALFAKDFAKLESLTTGWPPDINNEVRMLLHGVSVISD